MNEFDRYPRSVLMEMWGDLGQLAMQWQVGHCNFTEKSVQFHTGRVAGLNMPPNESEGELARLVARLALRDRAAFSRLYDLTNAKLFGVCLRMLRDRSLAEDALQEAYVRVWRNAAAYRPPADGAGQGVISWMIAIARNHSIDVLRSRGARSLGSHDSLDDAAELAAGGPDPEQSAITASTGRLIDKCMDELPGERAAAIRAAYVEGYSYDELASRHAVPVNTMRTWLRRGLLALRECLER